MRQIIVLSKDNSVQHFLFFFLMIRPPPIPTLFPYTPLSRSHPRRSLLLAVCCTAQFMVILDVAIVNVALPTIRTALGFSANDLQWVVSAYTIAFAGFLMQIGRAHV